METVDRVMEHAGYEKKSDSNNGMYIAGGIFALLVALLFVMSLPDLMRYIKIKSM